MRGLECGSLLPLLRLELARDAAGSKLPAKESGSKLPHSKTSPGAGAEQNGKQIENQRIGRSKARSEKPGVKSPKAAC
jgi:hypothetical protein